MNTTPFAEKFENKVADMRNSLRDGQVAVYQSQFIDMVGSLEQIAQSFRKVPLPEHVIYGFNALLEEILSAYGVADHLKVLDLIRFRLIPLVDGFE